MEWFWSLLGLLAQYHASGATFDGLLPRVGQMEQILRRMWGQDTLLAMLGMCWYACGRRPGTFGRTPTESSLDVADPWEHNMGVGDPINKARWRAFMLLQQICGIVDGEEKWHWLFRSWRNLKILAPTAYLRLVNRSSDVLSAFFQTTASILYLRRAVVLFL